MALRSNITHPRTPEMVAIGTDHPVYFEKKPAMRGWLHMCFAPIVFIAGIVLVSLAHGSAQKLACAIFALTGVILFGMSGAYHRSYWPEKTRMLLKRADHANIALVIAGTYTPIAICLLEGNSQKFLLWFIWICAAAVVFFRIIWTHAPRWLYTGTYIIMGLTAVVYLGQFWEVSPVPTILIAAGGAAYIIGAVFYAMEKPNLFPTVFGFHELFHACTIIGFTLHFIAVMFSIFIA